MAITISVKEIKLWKLFTIHKPHNNKFRNFSFKVSHSLRKYIYVIPTLKKFNEKKLKILQL